MQFKKFAFFAILATLLFSGCSDSSESKTANNDVKILKDRKVFLTTTENQVLSAFEQDNGLQIQELKGKAVLVNFFATWCPPCKAEIPHLNNLRQKYHKDFEIVGVLLEKNKSTQEIDGFISDFNVQYPVTNSNENYQLANVLGGVKSIPTMFMYDKSGKLLQKYVGIVPEEMLELDIKKAIQ